MVSKAYMIVLCFVVVAYAVNMNMRCWKGFLVSSNGQVAHSHVGLNNHSFFEAVIEESYFSVTVMKNQTTTTTSQEAVKFDVSKWTQRTNGGLSDKDRVTLGAIYSNAHSVFEYGLGESTYIANAVNVKRYAGIDSDVVWVDKTRKKVSPTFRFYYGDIGDTKAWGYPVDDNLAKIIYQYQVAPLVSEQHPFDVYMVDGRYRVACVLLSFLHASAMVGRSHNNNNNNTIVLLHDCYQKGHSPQNVPAWKKRDKYFVLDTVLDLVDHSKDFLCVYKRKPDVTDQILYELWQKYRYTVD